MVYYYVEPYRNYKGMGYGLPIVTADHLQNQVWILRETGSGTRDFSDKLIKDWKINVKKSHIFE